MLTKKLKHGDTFYYILKCHHNDVPVTFDVFAYEFHDGDDGENSFYDPKRMFNTREEAEEYAEILMKDWLKQKGYEVWYSKNPEHYHTIYHIETLLNLYETYKDEFKKEYPDLDEEALITAIKWHDSYYEVGNDDNESLSVHRYIDYNERHVNDTCAHNGVNPLVCLIIESTQIGYDFSTMHDVPELLVMHDLDWSGFNDYKNFKSNCEKICKEAVDSGKFDEKTVRQNQINFYRKFAEKPLYLTKTFSKFNNIAKENMLKLADELEEN